jgi:hypothetical protein
MPRSLWSCRLSQFRDNAQRFREISSSRKNATSNRAIPPPCIWWQVIWFVPVKDLNSSNSCHFSPCRSAYGQSCFPQLEKSIGHITCVYLCTKRVCRLRNYRLILVIIKVVVLKKWKPGNSRKCYIITHLLNSITITRFLAPVKLAVKLLPRFTSINRKDTSSSIPTCVPNPSWESFYRGITFYAYTPWVL